MLQAFQQLEEAVLKLQVLDVEMTEDATYRHRMS